MSFRRLNTLILDARDTDTLSYYDDWTDAFSTASFFSVHRVSVYDQTAASILKKRIRDYDLIVLMHSIARLPQNISRFKPFEEVMQKRKGKMLAFVGDEVNSHIAFLSEKIEFLERLQPEYIGTQLPLEAGQWLYEDCRNSQVIPLPHALNPQVYKPAIPDRSRRTDIGAVSGKYPPFLGDDERERILQFFTHHPFSPPLVIDIRPLFDARSRFTRQGWCDFLGNCRATVSTEAGTYFLEKDDRTLKAIMAYLISRQERKGGRVIKEESRVRKTWNRMPPAVRAFVLGKKDLIQKALRALRIRTEGSLLFEDAKFADIFEKFFKDYPRPPFYSKAISSRHFEAIGTKTCQIMFPGRFNDILVADRHYLALHRDFSNIAEVMEKYRDREYRMRMVDETYQYIMDTHTFHHRMMAVSELVSAHDPILFERSLLRKDAKPDRLYPQ